jgi:ABC-type Fe3+ transport system permease subunit
VSERAKHLARQWNREIEDASRATEARDRAPQPWRTVSWIALWLLWLVVLVAFVVRTNPLG